MIFQAKTLAEVFLLNRPPAELPGEREGERPGARGQHCRHREERRQTTPGNSG